MFANAVLGMAASGWIAVVAPALVAVGGFAVYNGLARKRSRCREAWRRMDTRLRQRRSLATALVEALEPQRPDTAAVCAEVAGACERCTSAGSIQARGQVENALAGALQKLRAACASNPSAGDAPGISSLHEELTAATNRIASARRRYNDAAAVYNAARQKFPGNVVAALLGFRERAYFDGAGPGG